ncbi:hypothetical protein [Demequina sp. NBRC 110057]|uniref:hypothetical protein n=1 Tax=Demequina sp. NBRC 110057 TaxID=1570346 RepID=UPI00117868D2|nr:hypothetical protein [Demequina sp. NBRC 110057]
MRAQRAAMVVGTSAVILTSGVLAAPDADDAVSEEPTTGATDATDDAADGATDATTDESTTDAGDGVTGTFDGPVVTNIRGDYQVSLTFENGVLVDVEFPVAGTDAPESVRINDAALPELEEEFLEAQDWDVEYVSGASFTSPAMVESAEAAFEEAGL